jgi:hypothetical protein
LAGDDRPGEALQHAGAGARSHIGGALGVAGEEFQFVQELVGIDVEIQRTDQRCIDRREHRFHASESAISGRARRSSR